MSNQPQTYQDVLARVRTVQQKRAADTEALNMKDPADKGIVTPPNHPDGDSNAKKQVPPSATNENGREGKDLTDKDTHPSSTGSNVPSTVDGKPKEDAATSPTVPLSKIAGNVGNILDRISALQQKQATTTAALAPKQAQAAPSNDDVANGIPLTPEFHLKLASLILEDEEGLEFAERILRKAAGAERATELIKAAMEQQVGYLQAADAYDQQVKYAAEVQAAEIQALDTFLKQASAEELQAIDKLAMVHGSMLSTLQTDWEKAAYQQGAEEAAAMADTEAAGGEPEIPGGGDGPMGPEEIMMLLQQMVEAGELDEQTATQIAEALMSEQGDEMGGEMGGEEMPLPEEAPEEAKMASALFKKIASKKQA